MNINTENQSIWEKLSSLVFAIGDEDQLMRLRQEFDRDEGDGIDASRFLLKYDEFLKDARIKIGTLLKTDSVSFLLGAGASRYAGGLLLGSVPLEIERDLLSEGIEEGKAEKWLEIFYQVINLESHGEDTPTDLDQIISRSDTDEAVDPIGVNLERVLTRLYSLRSSLPEGGGNLQINADIQINATSEELDTCIKRVKTSLAKHCQLPRQLAVPGVPEFHIELLRRILTRPLNLKRINLFTLNYDTLIEQAADATGVVLIDGFIGTIHRVFRPEAYDQDLYFPADTTEGRVHRLDRAAHLYKLHGSINWKSDQPDWDNPYGVSSDNSPSISPDLALIFPTPTKYGEILGLPYSELFRRFAVSTVRPQSTLFIIGYGFGDEHVNAIIRQALAIPSFTIVIITPSAPAPDSDSNSFIARLRAQSDRRVWILSGKEFGTFEGFVTKLLPDLRDQEIIQKVISTHRALSITTDAKSSGGVSNED